MRRRLLTARTIRVAVLGAVLAGTLTVLAAGTLHGGTQPELGTGRAAAYAQLEQAQATPGAPPGSGRARPPFTGPPPHNVFPVAGKASYARTHHDYPAADLFAACGTAFVAPADGTVEHLSPVNHWKPSTNKGADRGGLSVSVVGLDGVRYYGSHLRAVTASLKVGTAVKAGTVLGQVGQTGSAEGTGCHLHFGISPPCPQLHSADWWNRRGTVPPAAYLDAWRAGRQRSPAAQVAAWQLAHGCPAKPTVYP